MRTLIAATLVSLLPACQASVSTGDLQRALSQEPFIGFLDEDVEHLRQLEPSTTTPLRIGVAQPWTHPASKDAGLLQGWTRAEREAFEALGAALAAEGRIAELIVLPGLLGENEQGQTGADLLSLRRAAARHQLDAVIVCRSLSDVARGANVLAILDLTVIGAFILPSHHAVAASVVEGAVFDVRSEYLYASAIGEGHARINDPLASLEPSEALQGARIEATRELADQLLRSAASRHASWSQAKDPALASEPRVLELPGITLVQDGE
ncbi:MAG: hypothetical protein O2816_14030 [Planctomycetota bacterium]|nr:hypothetical protein [Planctomycetota bacterium]